MTGTTNRSQKVFCSYSHEDAKYLSDLHISLAGLREQGLIKQWTDLEITPGQEWDKAIAANLDTSQIILFLVTPDLMASEYVEEKEIKRALEKHERGEARVIPIIVRPTDWEWAPFGKLQALPTGAKPIVMRLGSTSYKVSEERSRNWRANRTEVDKKPKNPTKINIVRPWSQSGRAVS